MSNVYRQAVVKWGETAQLDMVIEEMAELTKEICKYKRGGQNFQEIAEEHADVLIMLAQLSEIMCTHHSRYDDFLSDADQFKIERLKDRLK